MIYILSLFIFLFDFGGWKGEGGCRESMKYKKKCLMEIQTALNLKCQKAGLDNFLLSYFDSDMRIVASMASMLEKLSEKYTL